MIEVIHWGLVDYGQALQSQEELVGDVARGARGDALVFCSHPPVVTIGRATPPEDYAGWAGDVIEVSRGGRATYHGPNQIVVYPIIDLNRARTHLPARDLHAYLRVLGQAIVLTTQEFGLATEFRQGEDPSEGTSVHRRHLTGVWLGERKLASLGIAARQWVTFHGLALNVSSGREGFSGIQPCGFSPPTMTSMAEALGQEPDRSVIASSLERNLIRLLT